MMWDLSGGRRSPLPPAGPPPPFPVPQHHHSLPPGQPASNVATQGTSYPSLSAFGSSVPSTARSDSYGFNHASTSYEYQAPRGIAFPSSPSHHSPSHYPAQQQPAVIGINYTGHSNELRGCVNDAKRVRQFLIKNGYPAENIVLLSDDTRDPRSLPTRKNIIAAMKWLVRGAQPNDALFFHYSGHGGQTPDLDGDELDGFDEVIYPLDFKKNGHITDDEMHDLMVKPLPDDCRLTGLFDACHSGTVLDLPYIYSSHGRLKGSHITDRARRRKATNADVISWSGCKDGQTSADTFHGGVAVGAMSHAFVSALTANPTQSYQELLRSVRLILHPRYSQKPQLGSSHHIDTALRFVF
ncbi:Metacaspase-1A [Ephemerocybe angulata]|uniref:Metacaspase-1A n=1 Tax=Ephemerocybe angulata TaxID=980116 RepID=A0A8H6I533_9AGAR|nr:Metacaspase-1A [Tulosesus angulatus]